MELTAEYIKLCDKMVLDNLENKELVVGPKRFSKRVARIVKFLEEHRTPESLILDIGSGAYMPMYLNTTHAIDVSAVPGHILRQSGWGGFFYVGSCDNIQFPDKSFDIAICTEVIEHLPRIEDVSNTFSEINRVAKKWILSTPRATMSGVRDVWNTEPTHVQFFTKNDVADLVVGKGIIIEEIGHHVFAVKN